MAALTVACKSKVTNMFVYGGLGAALWFCLLKGGINADIAGVIAAFAIPAAAAAPAGSKAPPEHVGEAGGSSITSIRPTLNELNIHLSPQTYV